MSHITYMLRYNCLILKPLYLVCLTIIIYYQYLIINKRGVKVVVNVIKLTRKEMFEISTPGVYYILL